MKTLMLGGTQHGKIIDNQGQQTIRIPDPERPDHFTNEYYSRRQYYFNDATGAPDIWAYILAGYATTEEDRQLILKTLKEDLNASP